MNMFFRLSVFVFLCGLANILFAEENDSELLETARKAYEQGDFILAEKNYKELSESGFENGHIFYNIGNVEYRLGRIGSAVAYYLAARRLLPRDPDVEANLHYVMQFSKDKLGVDESEDQQSIGKIFVISEWFTAREIYYFSMGFSFLFFFLLSFGIYRIERVRRVSFILIALVGTLCLSYLFGAMAYSVWYKPHWGAAVQAEAGVFSDPSLAEQLQPIFVLHEGAPAQVLKERAQWVYIRLSDGKVGWVSKDAFLFR